MKYFWKVLNSIEIGIFTLFLFCIANMFLGIGNYISISDSNMMIKFLGMVLGLVLIYGTFSELILFPLALIVFLLGYKSQKKGTYKYLLLYLLFFVIKFSTWFSILLLGTGGDHRYN